ncbi:MAG: hypothetical protein LAT77_05990 [Aliidiomarina sp.]|uniref:hypothetical protein n=1 Tax=Aliidiomarina sp. TaxID=1872439 RepID=UPI0025C086D3|nr:hypothetical protein [Aliidiomarina sp.]MCH8501446.1 hypothetical protein [Aliidiomarina sp.]
MYSQIQQACLTQLGISHFALALRSPSSVSDWGATEPSPEPSPVNIALQGDETKEQPLTEPNVYYVRLGPWLLQTSSRLPVVEPQWLSDLAAFIGAKVTEVSQPSEERQPINIDHFIGRTLTSTDKKQLWQLLSQQTMAAGRD